MKKGYLNHSFENIISAIPIKSKSLDQLYEVLYENESSKKNLIQIPNTSYCLKLPLSYPSHYISAYEQFIDESDTLNILLEPFINDLSSEIDQRAKKHYYFQEQEIWNLMMVGIAGLAESHSNKKPYGNLDLGSFVVQNEGVSDNSIKFKMFHPELAHSLEKLGAKLGEQRYFSIEELQALRRNSQISLENSLQDDIFHLGLTLLEMSTLLSITSCYDLEKSTINFHFISKKVEIIENRYSKELAFLIKIMLNMDRNRRPTVTELALLINKIDCLYGIQTIQTEAAEYEKEKKIKDFLKNNLKTNVCKSCIQNIRKKQEEIMESGSDDSNSNFQYEQKMYKENEKEWFNLQKNLTKNRSVLKSIDNQNY